LAEDSWPPSKTAEEKSEKGAEEERKRQTLLQQPTHCINIDERGLHRRRVSSTSFLFLIFPLSFGLY
jgi:hypothetical protein